MHAQLDRLQTAIDLPNVRLGVVPFIRQLGTTPQTAFAMCDGIAKIETPLGETDVADRNALASDRWGRRRRRGGDPPIYTPITSELVIRVLIASSCSR
jgi:hypothetical protein